MKKKLIEKIDITNYYHAHINANNVKFKQNGWSNNLCCPFPSHSDKKPSFGFNKDSGCFKCFACNEQGGLFKFEQIISNHSSENEAIKALAKEYGQEDMFSNLDIRVNRYQIHLQENKDRSLDALEKMGISRKIAIKNQLGYMPKRGKYEARLIFPIFDQYGRIITLKKYSRNAPNKCKSMFERGGKVSLYGIESIMDGKKIVLCAGEKDKNIAESVFDSEYSFVTFTGGENSLPKSEHWDTTVNYLKQKDVIICYDCDDAGKKGAQKVAKALAKTTSKISILEWPQEFCEKYKKGDICDFLTKWNKGKKDLTTLIENATVFEAIQTEETAPENSYRKRCGDIIEEEYSYTKEKKDDAITISNFIIIPKERIWVDDKEAVKVTLKSKKTNYEAIIEREAWISRSNFLKEIKSIDLAFRGSDNDLQCIQEIVANYDIPVCKGTRELGYQKEDNIFVLPNKIIGNQEQKTRTEFVPLKGQHPFQNMLNFLELPKKEQQPFLKEVFENLPNLNEKAPLSIMLGWLFAVPFKPQIMPHLRHFPILNIFGTRGSGKTSTAALLWRLMGFTGELFSCTQSNFSWLKLLSTTNCLPIFVDEYKPSDMTLIQVNHVHRLIRRIYAGEVETRGRQDQTLAHYKLQAPISIVGEMTFTEPAILERILPAPLSFKAMTTKRKQAHKNLNSLPLEAFASIYLNWALKQNTDEILELAMKDVKDIVENCPERPKDNMAIAIFGLRCMEKFAKDFSLPIPSFSKEEMMQLCLKEVCEVSGGKIAIDILLEKLAMIAEKQILRPKIHFIVDQEKGKGKKIYLRLKFCLPELREWAKKTGEQFEILDIKAYQRMFDERTSIYIDDPSKAKWLSNKTRRCIVIDVEKAVKFGLDIDGFWEG